MDKAGYNASNEAGEAKIAPHNPLWFMSIETSMMLVFILSIMLEPQTSIMRVLEGRQATKTGRRLCAPGPQLFCSQASDARLARSRQLPVYGLNIIVVHRDSPCPITILASPDDPAVRQFPVWTEDVGDRGTKASTLHFFLLKEGDFG